VPGGGEERDGRGWCEEGGARGEPFIGARGKGERWSFLAPASFTVRPLMPHSAAEGTLQRSGTGEDAGQGGRTERCQTSLCGEVAEGRTERWPEVTSVKRRRKDDEATDQRGRSARGSERARERAADGWGRLASERGAGLARAEAGRRWAESGGARRVGKGEVAGLGWFSVQQGEGKVFPFFFLLSNFYFPFCPFFF
jgi:hypothetical protein